MAARLLRRGVFDPEEGNSRPFVDFQLLGPQLGALSLQLFWGRVPLDYRKKNRVRSTGGPRLVGKTISVAHEKCRLLSRYQSGSEVREQPPFEPSPKSHVPLGGLDSSGRQLGIP